MYLLATIGIAILVILQWLINVPAQAFFVDVPFQIACIRDNSMHIQFPGYVPYHLIVSALTVVVGDEWCAVSLLSLCAAVGTCGFVMRSCRLLGGLQAAISGGLISASCALTTYITANGASYMFDALCASAVIYYGLQNLASSRSDAFGKSLVWFLLGVLIRPLSMIWMCPALLYLVYRRCPGAKLFTLAGGLVCTAVAIALFSLPFYDSLYAYFRSASQVGSELESTHWKQIATNVFRWAGYPLYLFHLWWGYIAWQCIRSRKAPIRPELVFVLAATCLYDLILLIYIPHAGYLCLLLPAIVIVPLTLADSPPAIPRPLVIAFVLVSLLQFYATKLLPPRGLKTAVVNTYFLQYSKSGIQQGRFETLSTELLRTGIATDEIPPGRREAAQQQMNERP